MIVKWHAKAAASGDGGTAPTADAGRARDLRLKAGARADLRRTEK